MSSRPDIPGFDVMELIGSGGFSLVYRALQTEFGREVAIKVLRIDGRDDEVHQAFERECALAGRLTGHPNVLTLFGSGFVPESGEPYLLLEYCPGGTLSKRISTGGPLPVNDMVAVGISLAGALHSAHRHGMVHRDVKPQNVLYTRAGVPVLADFGVAKLRNPDTLSVTSSGLTPLHAAPEVLRQGPASPASDLYSLGSSLYTALSGHAPFGSSTDEPYLVMQRSINDPVPELGRRDVPVEVQDLIGAAMAKQPSDRPTVPEFAAELRRCAQRRSATVPDFVVLEPPSNFDPNLTTDSVIGAELTPSPAVVSLQRTRRRRRTNRSLMAVVGVVLLLVAISVTWVVARRSGPAAGAVGAPSTTANLPTGLQRESVTYPTEVVADTNFQHQAVHLAELGSLLGIPAPQLGDRPLGYEWLQQIPVNGSWVATNAESIEACQQMISDPIELRAAGQVVVVPGPDSPGLIMTLTTFADARQATQFFNAASVNMGVFDCVGAQERQPRLVVASGQRIRFESPTLPMTNSRTTGLEAVNTWIGLKGLSPGDLNALSKKSGYTAVALINSTVIQLLAGDTGHVKPETFDQILTVGAELAGA